MGKRVSIPTKAIEAALRTTDGGVYLAAERLGCTPQAIYDRMTREPGLRELKDNLRGKLVDIAETSLKRGVIAGEGWAVCFTLKTLAKDRGYVERQEITGKDGAAIQTEVVVDDSQRSERVAALLDQARARRDRRPDRGGKSKTKPG